MRIDGTCVKDGQTSPYAYLPYYLPHIAPGLERIIYLDTDIVVRTDITELADMPMHGFPLAAVRLLVPKFPYVLSACGSPIWVHMLGRSLELLSCHSRGLQEPFGQTLALSFLDGQKAPSLKQWISKHLPHEGTTKFRNLHVDCSHGTLGGL